MSTLIEQLSELSMNDDVAGMVDLLEQWTLHDDDWIAAVEVRIRAPSSTAEQKNRLKRLQQICKDENDGSDLTKIRSSLGIVKKLIELEDNGAELDTPIVISWLESIEKIDLVMERVDRVPDSLYRMRNLKSLTLFGMRLPHGVALLPDSLESLEQLETLELSQNRLRKLPALPKGLKRLIVDDNPKLTLDLMGLSALEELSLNGVGTTPVGIADLQNLSKLRWQDSPLDEFPAEFLGLALLASDNIDLEGSEMVLPESYLASEPAAPPFNMRDFGDPEITAIAEAIVAFNQAVPQLYGNDDDDDDAEFDIQAKLLIECEAATQTAIDELKSTLKVSLPTGLEKLYRNLGGIQHHYVDETWVIDIPTPENLLRYAQPAQLGSQLQTMGLIDTIRWAWGNSRPEFDPGVNFTQAELDELNGRYKCFGLWRDDWGLEAAFYFYFDRDGQYGTIYYHQDYGDVIDELQAILTESSASQTLTQVIANALATMTAGLKEEMS